MKPRQVQDCVISDGIRIDYTYHRSSRRRTLSVTVRPDRSVTVRVPSTTPLAVIRSFVDSRAAWIARVCDEFNTQSPLAAIPYADGVSLRYLGRDYRLMVVRGSADRVTLSEDNLFVETSTEANEDRLQAVVDAWYRQRAVEIFGMAAAACQQRMQAEGIHLPRITIRPMTSRWGSYSYRTGRISLNLNLIKTSLECIDYVIIHELCHIRVRHHGADFWKMVERYVPDHARLRKQLKSG